MRFLLDMRDWFWQLGQRSVWQMRPVEWSLQREQPRMPLCGCAHSVGDPHDLKRRGCLHVGDCWACFVLSCAVRFCVVLALGEKEWVALYPYSFTELTVLNGFWSIAVATMGVFSRALSASNSTVAYVKA